MEYVYASAILWLALVVLVGYFFVRLPIVRKLYMPTAVIAGIFLLIIGPEVLGKTFQHFLPLPAPEIYGVWSMLPKYLINIVFATLLIGKPILKLRDMWKLAGPHVAFGQMMAWGQYAIGGLVVLLVLSPVFAFPIIGAALLEMSFEGGHGTVAGMERVFTELGFESGQDIALGMATASLVTALVTGMIFIAIGRRFRLFRSEGLVATTRNVVYHRRIIKQIRSKGVRLREHLTPLRVLYHLILVGLGVLIGWFIHAALLQIETMTWGQAGVVIIGYLPIFPLCMFGGMLAQWIWTQAGLEISREIIDMIGGLALLALITTAIGTMSLSFLSSDWMIFIILYLAGVSWVVFCFVFLAKKIFPENWFQNAIVNYGQAMGMTATGLLFAQMTDPKNRTNAVEGFGYKQLMFEPFMGGGVVTALAMPIILAIGLGPFTAICAIIALFWMTFGLVYFSKKKTPRRRR